MRQKKAYPKQNKTKKEGAAYISLAMSEGG